MKNVECGACLELVPAGEAVERKRAFYCPTCIKDRPTQDITIHLFNEVEKLVPEYDEMGVQDLIEEVSIEIQEEVDPVTSQALRSYKPELIKAVADLVNKHNFKAEY